MIVMKKSAMVRTVTHEVIDEHRYQIKKFGAEMDDEKSPGELMTMVVDYARKARLKYAINDEKEARKKLIEAAALCISTVESMDRKAQRKTS